MKVRTSHGQAIRTLFGCSRVTHFTWRSFFVFQAEDGIRGAQESRGLGTGAERIIEALIVLGRTLGLDVVAEGVETRDQAEWLVRRHCPKAQGFYYGRPAPAPAPPPPTHLRAPQPPQQLLCPLLLSR